MRWTRRNWRNNDSVCKVSESVYQSSYTGSIQMKTMIQECFDNTKTWLCSLMARTMRENGIPKQNKDTEGATRYGVMEVFTKDIGKVTRQMVVVGSFTLMVTFMTDTGKTTRLMDLASIRTLTAPSTKAIGLTISNTAREKNIGPMAHNTRVSTSSERKMVMANFCGLIDLAIAANSLTIIFTAKELTPGPMVEFTTETGNRIRCMAKVYLRGQTGASTKVNTMMIRNKDTESFTGLMEDSMMDTGCQVNKKE